jgi:hypothetical protein
MVVSSASSLEQVQTLGQCGYKHSLCSGLETQGPDPLLGVPCYSCPTAVFVSLGQSLYCYLKKIL